MPCSIICANNIVEAIAWAMCLPQGAINRNLHAPHRIIRLVIVYEVAFNTLFDYLALTL
jgi:hypothetical protein